MRSEVGTAMKLVIPLDGWRAREGHLVISLTRITVTTELLTRSFLKEECLILNWTGSPHDLGHRIIQKLWFITSLPVGSVEDSSLI